MKKTSKKMIKYLLNASPKEQLLNTQLESFLSKKLCNILNKHDIFDVKRFLIIRMNTVRKYVDNYIEDMIMKHKGKYSIRNKMQDEREELMEEVYYEKDYLRKAVNLY